MKLPAEGAAAGAGAGSCRRGALNRSSLGRRGGHGTLGRGSLDRAAGGGRGCRSGLLGIGQGQSAHHE